MTASEDLISFDVIESQKENIQSLPTGRSAKKLAELFSPLDLTTTNTTTTTTAGTATANPGDTLRINDALRAEFEALVTPAALAESDDPLDAWDRYVRWTLDAYPSAQSTAASRLCALLERATRPYVRSPRYRNDARYLRLWLHHVRWFADAPREAFAFLARHGVGDALALFYEEFAAWLEREGRWAQADEVLRLGLDREAQPLARLRRHHAEFRRRMAAADVDLDGVHPPASPAIPTIRPALAAKVDPFAAAAAPPTTTTPVDPQAAPRRNNGTGAGGGGGPGQAAAAGGGRKPKLAVFSDAEPAAPPSLAAVAAEGPGGWENIGSLAERKKENVVEPRPWVGETLKAGGKKNAGPKMAIFRDTSISQVSNANSPAIFPSKDQVAIHPQTGKREVVFVKLGALYLDVGEGISEERNFEEVWAANRGWLDRTWEDDEAKPPRRSPLAAREVEKTMPPPERLVVHQDAVVMLDENGAVMHSREGRGKKKKVMEVNETQIIKAKLDSPSGPKMRKKAAEPTMTIHTKAATDEIYELFNQPAAPTKPAAAEDDESDNDLYEETDGDYTSGAESTGTTRHVEASEAGDDEDRDADDDDGDDDGDAHDIDETSDVKSVSEWSDFTARKHIPLLAGGGEEAGGEGEVDVEVAAAAAADESGDINLIRAYSSENTAAEDHHLETDHSAGSGPTTYHTADQTRSPPTAEADDEEEVDAVDAIDAVEIPDAVDDALDSAASDGGDEEDDGSDADEEGEDEHSAVATTPTEGGPPRGVFVPVPPPGDYDPPTRRWRDAEDAANCRLPFMTPITERTESSSLGLTTYNNNIKQHRQDAAWAKTPSKRGGGAKDGGTSPGSSSGGSSGGAEEMGGLDEEEEEEQEQRDDDGEPFSSPLRDVVNDEPAVVPQPRPKMPQPLLRKAGGGAPCAKPAPPPQQQQQQQQQQQLPLQPPKGPLVKDGQCSPMDEALRAEILARTVPPLKSHAGFFDHRGASSSSSDDGEEAVGTCGRAAELRRFAKSLAKSSSSAPGARVSDRTSSFASPPVLLFPGAHAAYTVRRELGRGAFAPVYLVENEVELAREEEEGEEGGGGATAAEDVEKKNGAERKEEVVAPVMGKGAFAVGPARRALEAVKVESDPASAWEFHMLRLAHGRLGPHHRASSSIAHALELHLFRDESYLVLPYSPHGTLLDVVNHFRGEGAGTGVDELLAMFFTVELLRTVEALHAKHLMHGDLKPDNCMLRLDDEPGGGTTSHSTNHMARRRTASGQDPAAADADDQLLSPRYRADGGGGWARRGVTLIDLGRGVDMRCFGPEVRFVADWRTGPQDPAELREGRPWSWHLDYHGLAGVVHCLLFGRYIETVRCDANPTAAGGGSPLSVVPGAFPGAFPSSAAAEGLGGGLGNAAGRRYRVRENLKRYWQTDLWAPLFDMLLNPVAAAAAPAPADQPHGPAEEAGRMPLLRSLRRSRLAMEAWLETNCDRGVGLRTLLARVEAWARAGRR